MSTPADAADGADTEPASVGVGPWPGGRAAWPDDPRLDPDLLAYGDRRNVVDQYRYWTVAAIVADLDTRRHSFHVAIENWQHDLNIGSVVRTANAFAASSVHIIGRRRWNRRGAMVTDRYLHVWHHPDVAAFAAWCAAPTGVGAGEDPGGSGAGGDEPASQGPSVPPGRSGDASHLLLHNRSSQAGDRVLSGQDVGSRESNSGLAIIGIDNVPGSVPIEGYALPPECVLLFGQESIGLTPEAQAACQDVLHITQFGSTRSINAGAAAAIAMHTWVRQHAAV